MIKSIFKNCFIALLVIFSFSSYSFGKNAIEKANEFLLDIGLIEGLNTLKKGDIFVTLGAGSTILKSLCDSAKQLNL